MEDYVNENTTQSHLLVKRIYETIRAPISNHFIANKLRVVKILIFFHYYHRVEY